MIWQPDLPDANALPEIEPHEGCTDEFIGYLPIDCPRCGRRRVEGWLRTPEDGRPFVVQVRCEKCRYLGSDA